MRTQPNLAGTPRWRPWRTWACGVLAAAGAAVICAPAAAADSPEAGDPGPIAPKPLFRDPVHDGAADPVVRWNQREQKWFMLYTNRRANLENPRGVDWVHGTRIGIAESSDGGATWTYRGTADIRHGEDDYSHWAPEVVEHAGLYHMYLTVVPGTFSDWNAGRDIVHLTSSNLVDWTYRSTLELASDRVIDACVYPLPDGTWRMWYNNERDGKSIYIADSPDLYTWTDRGKAVGDRPGEGPVVFRWQDQYWMVVDNWEGLGVYRSENAKQWERQPENLLAHPGAGTDDQVKGGHPDVVVSGDRAFLFYFTHPGRRGADAQRNGYEQRRSSIQVVELHYQDGWLHCDRDQPTHIRLSPPSPLDTLPPSMRRITYFGERADWSHDGRRILFLERTFGDVFEVEVATGIIRPITHHFFHEGFTRALYLANGDILLSGARTFDSTDPWPSRGEEQAELWVLDRELTGPPVPLGEHCSEGPAVSRRRMHIAWTRRNAFWAADIVYRDGVAELQEKRKLLDAKDLPFECHLETQNFRPPEEQELIFSAYGYQGGEVCGLNLLTGEVVNYSNAPDQYDEPEGIFPDGRHTLIEGNRHQPAPNEIQTVDIYKLALDGSGHLQRMTRFADVPGYKSSNPVVSDDGRNMAFQFARYGDPAGVGRGLLIMDLNASGLEQRGLRPQPKD